MYYDDSQYKDIFVLYEIFDDKILMMLGSKVLGFYVFRTLFCIVGKP